MKKQLVQIVPEVLRPTLRKMYHSAKKFYYLLMDPYDRIKGRVSMIPPRSMIFIGNGDFKSTGQEFKRYFIELANMQPTDRVLDVGCGIGRMAIPLTAFLAAEGEYWGFDIVKSGIDWCCGTISPKFKNFHFQHIDVVNKTYNKDGHIQAKDFRFPFDDSSFDFVFLTSVFTHMFPADMERYLTEIARVLKHEGKCLITYFLLNDESTHLVRAGRSTLDFKYNVEGCLTTDKENPEFAMAYKEDHVRRLFDGLSLKIIEPVNYGSWCGRDVFLSYQDIIVATKGQAS